MLSLLLANGLEQKYDNINCVNAGILQANKTVVLANKMQ